MIRYLVFGGQHYYPSGGMEDFVSAHESLDFAIFSATTRRQTLIGSKPAYEWWHILDLQDRRIVKTSGPGWSSDGHETPEGESLW